MVLDEFSLASAKHCTESQLFYMFHAVLLHKDSSTILSLKIFPSKRTLGNMNNVCHIWLVFCHCYLTKQNLVMQHRLCF